MPNLMRRATVVLTGAVIVASVLAAGGPALAASTPQADSEFESGNWAGYYTVADGPIHGATGRFTVPSVNCRDSRGPKPYYGSMWVGIGGMGNTGRNSIDPGGPAWLEQAGVNVTCSSLNAKPEYDLFWEIVPPPGQGNPCSSGYNGSFGNAHVKAGDTVLVLIDPPANSPKLGYWYIRVSVSSPLQYEQYVQLPDGAYTGQTVEAITEYPTHVNNACHEIPSGFVYLGTVHYTNAVYLAGGLRSGISMLTNRIVLYHNGSLAVSPGEPYTSATSSADNDSFNTSYAKNWWR